MVGCVADDPEARSSLNDMVAAASAFLWINEVSFSKFLALCVLRRWSVACWFRVVAVFGCLDVWMFATFATCVGVGS